jgi:hypothetical protein
MAAYARALLKADRIHAELETFAKRFYSGYNNSDGALAAAPGLQKPYRFGGGYRDVLAASRRMDAQVLKVMKHRQGLLRE